MAEQEGAEIVPADVTTDAALDELKQQLATEKVMGLSSSFSSTLLS